MGISSKLGIMISGRGPFSELVKEAQAAESAGFHSIYSGDGGGDVFSTLSTFAVNTKAVKLGTSIALWHRPPVVTANAAAQLAELSGDRLILGLGPGPRDRNLDWWGIPWDRPIGRMNEYVKIIRGVWETRPGSRFNFEGKHFTLKGVPTTGRKMSANPEIWLATVGEQMHRLAGRHADGVFLDVCLPVPYLKEVAFPAVEEGLRLAGRGRSDIKIIASIPTWVDSDKKAALRGVKRSILGHLEQEYFYPAWRSIGHEEEAIRAHQTRGMDEKLDILSDELAAAVGIAGSPDECRKQLEAWLEIADFVVLLAPGTGVSYEEMAANRRRIFETFGGQ